MKAFQKGRFFTVVFFAILTIFACSKDDDFADQSLAVNATSTSTDSQTDTNNGSTGGNANNPVGNNGEITSYRVNDETIIKLQDYQVSGQNLAYQQDTQKHQEIWALVKKIVPPAYRGKMNEFLIYDGSVNGSVGFVVQTSSDLSTWRMGIAINYAYQGGFNADGELAYTIIHEFGHILTLDNTQLDASVSQGACSNYYPGEGCAKTASYINKLHTRFWADIWTEYQQAQSSQSALQEFYNTHRDRFVTNYAATNPGEDIAEVFAVFVTRSGGANGNSIAEQKIQLMYDHSELVSLRNYIRSNTESTSRARSFLPAPGSWKQANTLGDPNMSHCTH